MENKITVELKYIDLKEADDVNIMLGGRDDNPTFKEYLKSIDSNWKEKMIALKEYIEKSDLYKAKAEVVCNRGVFVFSDGKKLAFTWRAWGDFMQSVVGKREGYMAYYM